MNLGKLLDLAGLILGIIREALRDEPDLRTSETEDAIAALEADLAGYREAWERLRSDG
jgi:hypothetical protein